MNSSDLDAALRELWKLITSDELRNLLASGRVLAEVARKIYHYVVTTTRVFQGAAHTSQAVTVNASATLYPAGGE